MLSPLILTLELDADAFETLNALRKAHFPPERNYLDAHITLFHKLPDEQEEIIKTVLQKVSSETSVFSLTFPNLRFLGKGVAINADSTELLEFRKKLVQSFGTWLEAQDKQPFKPHVTIQNKVSPEEARGLLEHLSNEWTPFTGQGTGLLLWRYLGGPWELLEKAAFKSN